MEYEHFGNGERLPMVGFGTWDVTGRAGVRTIADAIGLGYRLIDTAHMYDNERVVGGAAREWRFARGSVRDDKARPPVCGI